MMIRALRIVRWASLGLIVLIALGLAFLKFGPETRLQHQVQSGTYDAPAGSKTIAGGTAIGGPFHLIDDRGRPVTAATYRGRWLLVFFGYTNCPDECPLTLQKMAAALKGLGSLADRIAPLFVTVDPARDTSARLASYLDNFDPRIVGLTGSSEQIAAAAKAYRVYYSSAEHEQSGADIISHSTFLYLMDASGKLDSLFSQDISTDKLIAALRARLSSQKQAAQPN